MVELHSFNGDVDELAQLMRSSWAENQQEPLLYTNSFLGSALKQPGASTQLCPALYDQGRLVGFGAGFPRTINTADKRSRVFVLDSFVTVAPTHKGRGLGGVIWNAIAELAKQHGSEGLVSFCVEGDRMNQVILRFSDQYDLKTWKAFTVQYLARPVPQKNDQLFQQADPRVLLTGAQRFLADVPFVRVWTEEQAVWQCSKREGAFGANIADGCSAGTITAYAMQSAGARSWKCGLVDDIIWGDLNQAAKSYLVAQLLDSASAVGVELLLVPLLNYADAAPFIAAGFRKSRRTLHLYLTSWAADFETNPLASAYIDVF